MKKRNKYKSLTEENLKNMSARTIKNIHEEMILNRQTDSDAFKLVQKQLEINKIGNIF